MSNFTLKEQMFKTRDFPSPIWHQRNSKFFFYNCESIMLLEEVRGQWKSVEASLGWKDAKICE